jgi:phosphoenolpyruvate carboxykinase (ATP)
MDNTLFTQSISLKDLGIESTKIHQLSPEEYTTSPYKPIKDRKSGALAVNTWNTGRSLKIVLSKEY